MSGYDIECLSKPDFAIDNLLGAYIDFFYYQEDSKQVSVKNKTILISVTRRIKLNLQEISVTFDWVIGGRGAVSD